MAPLKLQECSSQDSSLELCDISDSCLDDSRLQSALSCDSTRSRERTRHSDSRSLDVSDASSVHSRSPSASINMVSVVIGTYFNKRFIHILTIYYND